MGRSRNLGHISAHHGMAAAVQAWFDQNDLSGSAISQVYESRLDVVEEDQQALGTALNNEIQRSKAIDTVLATNLATLSSSHDSDITLLSSSALQSRSLLETSLQAGISALSSSHDSDITLLSSSALQSRSLLETSLQAGISALSSSAYASRSDMFVAIQSDITSLSSSVSSSIALLSASIGELGGITVTGTSELTFDGDTLLTDANIYLSGASNNLYINGTNEQGNPAKYEFSVVSGGVFIDEVPESDFGDSVEDPWFKFDGDTLLTHADIYVSGSGNYLYMNGTNRDGEYAKYYFDVISGSVFVFESGSN